MSSQDHQIRGGGVAGGRVSREGRGNALLDAPPQGVAAQGVAAPPLDAAAPDGDGRTEVLVAAAVQGAAEAVAKVWGKQQDEVTEAEALDVLTSFCWGGLSLLMNRIARSAPVP